ncbi:MAG: metal-dependent transcriptional regulator [bacterium]|nr:metal-dependent transcriptional regulator [bacterium]
MKKAEEKLINEKKEDILKFLYKQLQENKITTFSDLQLFSNLKPDRLIKIIHILLREKKIKYDNENVKLTSEGIQKAEKIIEKHRKIEKYLFENTSISIEEIHSIAEKEEHAETKIPEHQNSYECVDPHGDVIKGNSIPYKSLLSVIHCPEKIYKIIHIEDEPKEIYAKIVKMDLAPFEYIKIIQLKDKSIDILTNKGQKLEIDIITANNIFIAEEKDENIEKLFEEIEKKISQISTLDKLKIKEKAKIIGISFYIRGEEKRRLLELGFVKNSIVEPLYNNMLGDDPRVYKIKNTMIALRKEQAQKIYVEKLV